jgi:hypothetical protein
MNILIGVHIYIVCVHHAHLPSCTHHLRTHRTAPHKDRVILMYKHVCKCMYGVCTSCPSPLLHSSPAHASHCPTQG